MHVIEGVHPRCLVRWMLAAAVAWAIYGLLLYGNARHEPESCAFDPTPFRDQLAETEARRTQRSFLFFSQLADLQTDEAPASDEDTEQELELCIVISTVDRHGPRYLLQSAASVLLGLNEEQNQTSKLLVVNTDTRNKSIEYSSDLELLRASGVEVIDEATPHAGDGADEWQSKERDDYLYALDQCRKLNPKYVLALADDVWAADEWYTRLLPNLRQLDEADAQRTGGGGWAFVKLYMAARYDDYDIYLDANDVSFFVSYGVVWGLLAIVVYVAFLLLSHLRRNGRGSITSLADAKGVIARDWNTLLCFFLVCNVIFAALMAPVCIGKQNFSLTRKPEGIWPTKARCCTQAQLFKAGPLLDGTIECVKNNHESEKGVDLLISDCARDLGGTIYENIPHLFQHTGIRSSVPWQNEDSSWVPHMSVYFQQF